MRPLAPQTLVKIANAIDELNNDASAFADAMSLGTTAMQDETAEKYLLTQAKRKVLVQVYDEVAQAHGYRDYANR